MNTVIGDLLKVKRGIICHQVNCKYVMGAGLAAQIRKAYPEHYSDYMSRYAHLGGLCITQINSDLYVIGIYGQDSYGRNGGYPTNRVDVLRKEEPIDCVQGIQIPFVSHQRAGRTNQQNAGLLPVCVQPHAGAQNQSIQAAQGELQLHWDAESASRDEEVSAVAHRSR